MMLTRDRLVVPGALSRYLFGFGFACGVACERIRFAPVQEVR